MNDQQGYSTWSGTAMALKTAAQRRSEETGVSVQQLLKVANFDRLLTRVFSHPQGTDWLLKGGTGMLSRVPDARATKDLDLVTTGVELEQAQDELVALVHQDIGDHITFRLSSVRETSGGDNQPGVHSRRLTFEMLDADSGKRIDTVPVDMAVEPAPVGRVEILDPATRLETSKQIPTAAYRMFPLTDQVADKVCASMQTYHGSSSSRVKDLVDLVVISKTQTVDLAELAGALAAEQRHRGMKPIREFSVPQWWPRLYTDLATKTPACKGYTAFETAMDRVSAMVNPAMEPRDESGNATWTPDQGWVQDPQQRQNWPADSGKLTPAERAALNSLNGDSVEFRFNV